MSTTKQSNAAEQRRFVDSLERLSKKPELDFDAVTREANDNPMLSEVIVKAANASKQGLKKIVSSPSHAAVMLGANKLQGLIEQLLQDQRALESAAASTKPNDPVN